jgi:hypothetical protein
MSSSAELEFRSSARPGFAGAISSHPRRVTARKRVQEVHVQFATAPCTVQTREGVVHARAGDAIVTGTAGERWRVSRAHFSKKYRPGDATVDGEAGTYLSLPNTILAVSMTEGFQVVLADGISKLKGRAGDWLVDYGDGNLGIVSPEIFTTTYEVIG